MRWTRRLLLTLALSGSLFLPTVGAQARHYHEGYFYGRSFDSLGPRDLGLWRGGHWVHDWHGGRYGWWWIVGGWWYFYPAPVYPYPRYVPPAVVVQQPPPVPTGLPPAPYWYFCDSPQGYYPYVASCNRPWRTVPATPTVTPFGAAPP
jgi:hypothetical protein